MPWRRWTRVLGRCLLVGAALLPSLAAAQVLGPGHEEAFRELLGPQPLGWRIEGIRIEPRRAVYALRRGEARATIVLGPPTTATETFSVQVRADDGVAPQALDALTSHARRAVTDAGFDPWIAAGDAPTPKDASGDERRAAYAALATALAVLWLVAAARRRKPTYVVAAVGTALVVAGAWAADDAFIVYRYVDQALDGHGLVFNRGERVQGFTNPLWVLALLIPSALVSPFDASMLSSILCTTALWGMWARLTPALGWSRTEAAAGLATLLGCETFVAFQTSGLENPLSHLLVATLLWAALDQRRGTIAWATALLVLTRFDHALFALPVLVGVARSPAPRGPLSSRERRAVALAVMLVVAWLGFATLYYGYPLPNTFYAKTGEGWPVGRGLRYLLDLALHEPLTAAVLTAGLGALLRRPGPTRWLAIGALLHLGYVVLVGGDYMRGRFVSTSLVVAGLGIPLLLRRVVASRPGGLAAVAAVSLASFVWTSRAHDGEVVSERAYHPDNQLAYVRPGHLRPHELPVAPADAALSGRVMARAFTDDPRIVWIDVHGLTDPVIARCPALPGARAGHVERRVPRAYFVARRDARLLPDGEARLRRGDPDLVAELRRMPARWPTRALARRHAELRLLATGPLFDPDRLRLIARYALSLDRLVVPPDAETFAPP